MDPNDKLKQAANYARQMSALPSPEDEEKLRDKIARDFFGEKGIPPELKQGWAVLEQLRKEREKVNYPLPPGGCLLLGRESVLAGCMAELHTALANMLHMSVDCIRLRLEKDDFGKIRPAADVEPPDDWVIPVAKNVNESPAAAAQRYLQQCLNAGSKWFAAAVSERLDGCESRRTDLEQPGIPWRSENGQEQTT